MNYFTRTIIFVSAVIILSLGVFPVAAQVEFLNQPNCGFPGFVCGSNNTFLTLRWWFTSVINTVLTLVSTVAAVFLVYAGITYISSVGNEEKIAQAKRQITYAILGIIISLSTWVILIGFFNPFTGLPWFAPSVEPLRAIISTYTNLAISLAGIIATFFLVHGGYKYMLARGDQEGLETAKREITYALIGLIIIGAAYTIVGVFVNPATNQARANPANLLVTIRNIVNAILAILGVVAVIYTIMGGVMYIMSTGNEEKTSAAKRQIIYAVIGLAVILLASAIVNFIITALL